MASLGTPKAWIPYLNTKDCSQGFCSLYCRQWCSSIFYPPPPHFEFPDENSSPTFSPLVIAIIGILASAFLLVSYYTIISKYCGNNDSARRGENDHNNNNNNNNTDETDDNNHNPSVHEPWEIATTGLDEALIKSITVCKYNKGDGLIGVTDCSVCLSEFEEDETVRLLPKCSHAFHVPCIDTWLKSHSNCPLCRANIVFISAAPLPPPAVAETPQQSNELPLQGHHQQGEQNAAVACDTERDIVSEQEEPHIENAPKTPLRVFSDLGNMEQRDTIIEIRDIDQGCQHLRRSVSMDHSCQNHASVANVLCINQENGEDSCLGDGVGTSKHSSDQEMGKFSYTRRVLHYCVPSPATMRRSFSSGRFFLASRH